jgi:hypothetical protein
LREQSIGKFHLRPATSANPAGGRRTPASWAETDFELSGSRVCPLKSINAAGALRQSPRDARSPRLRSWNQSKRGHNPPWIRLVLTLHRSRCDERRRNTSCGAGSRSEPYAATARRTDACPSRWTTDDHKHAVTLESFKVPRGCGQFGPGTVLTKFLRSTRELDRPPNRLPFPSPPTPPPPTASERLVAAGISSCYLHLLEKTPACGTSIACLTV